MKGRCDTLGAMARERSCTLLGLWLAAGCGPTVTLDDPVMTSAEGSTSMSDGQTETGADETGAAPEVCVPSPVAGDDPLGDETECAAFFPSLEEGVPQLEVEIVNAADEAILVSNRTFGCGSPTRYFDASGTAGGRSLASISNFCSLDWPTCLLWSDEELGCTLCQPLHPDLFIVPGGSRTVTWDAVALATGVLPAVCQSQGGREPVECVVATPFGSGTYELSARAATVFDCLGDCACEADEDGACASELPTAREFDRMATATWDGACDRVVLTFE